MALETMHDVEEIDGTKIYETEDMLTILNEWEEIPPIMADTVHSCLFFKIQDGPIKEVGKNGVQVEDVIKVAHHIVTKLNEKFQCAENEQMIYHLNEAIHWSKKRTENRLARDVEGLSKA